MNGFQQRLATRLGHPVRRRGALKEAVAATGLSGAVILRWLDDDGPSVPSPANLERVAPWLDVSYTDLLLEVYGKQTPAPKPERPITPHDRLLRASDVLAAAVAEIKSAVLDMGAPSQPNNSPRTHRVGPRTKPDYIYQTGVVRAQGRPTLTVVRSALPDIPTLGDFVDESVA